MRDLANVCLLINCLWEDMALALHPAMTILIYYNANVRSVPWRKVL